MSRMETIAEQSQGPTRLHHAGDSDLSDVSLQSHQTSESFPGTRQSSITTEPLTLDSEEIGNAKVEAEHVLESVCPEEAADIFTKDLQLKNGQVTTEEEMVKKMFKQTDKNTEVKNVEAITEEIAEKVANQYDNLEQKAAEIVGANENLASKDKLSDGEQPVHY